MNTPATPAATTPQGSPGAGLARGVVRWALVLLLVATTTWALLRPEAFE